MLFCIYKESTKALLNEIPIWVSFIWFLLDPWSQKSFHLSRNVKLSFSGLMPLVCPHYNVCVSVALAANCDMHKDDLGKPPSLMKSRVWMLFWFQSSWEDEPLSHNIYTIWWFQCCGGKRSAWARTLTQLRTPIHSKLQCTACSITCRSWPALNCSHTDPCPQHLNRQVVLMLWLITYKAVQL